MPRNTKRIRRYGYDAWLHKPPGGCIKCDIFEKETVRHKPKDCDVTPYFMNHDTTDHAYTTRCDRYCYHCMKEGHTMLYCRKIKDCVLCGKSGHNPRRCWRYCSIRTWLERADELGRCCECLTLLTAGAKECTHCDNKRIYKFPFVCPSLTKESQTEENSSIAQECQTELQERKSTIEDQRLQIEELNSKISSLENQLERSNTTIDSLDWKLQSITKEKEQELQKANKLDSLCKQKEIELRRLQEQISQKDLELEQHRQVSAQPSQTIPATAQQPCPTLTSNNVGHCNETTGIKATLLDLQDQQQKLSVVVNHLYNKMKTQDMHWHNYSSFNPYLGPYDTGQYFNKLQQV